MKAALLVGLLLALTACGFTHRLVQAPPVAAGCDQVCFDPCAPANTALWTADPTQAGAWDAIGEQVVQPLKQAVATCETAHRQACHRCLWRLQQQGVLVGIPPPPAAPKKDPPR